MNIIEMAEQAGMLYMDYIRVDSINQLEKFAELVAAHEREECAKMVDHILKAGGGTYGDAIRARSKA
jgi:hypothetical protein